MLCEISFGIFLFCYITEIASADSRENFIETVSNNVYHDIKKRLNNYPNSYNNLPRDDSYSNAMCDFQVNEAVIIKTTESTDYGAEFLSFVPGLLTKEECQIQCCLTAQCNLAVFKENVKVGDEHACYLFDCGVPSVCRFSNHTGYVSMALEGGKLAKDQEEKHESDLALLAAKSTTTTTTEAPTTTTTTTPPTTTTLSTTTEYKAPVGLFGSCTENQDCASSGTECLAGYCVCQERYRAQDGLCRRICKRFEVSCANHGRPLAEPQCVPIYDKCDGTAQCQDGSDEANCPFDSPNNNDAIDMSYDTDPAHSYPVPQDSQYPIHPENKVADYSSSKAADSRWQDTAAPPAPPPPQQQQPAMQPNAAQQPNIAQQPNAAQEPSPSLTHTADQMVVPIGAQYNTHINTNSQDNINQNVRLDASASINGNTLNNNTPQQATKPEQPARMEDVGHVIPNSHMSSMPSANMATANNPPHAVQPSHPRPKPVVPQPVAPQRTQPQPLELQHPAAPQAVQKTYNNGQGTIKGGLYSEGGGYFNQKDTSGSTGYYSNQGYLSPYNNAAPPAAPPGYNPQNYDSQYYIYEDPQSSNQAYNYDYSALDPGRLGSGSGDQKGYGIPPHNQAIPSQQQVSSAQQPQQQQPQQQQPQQQQPQQQQPVVQGSPHTNQPQQAANVPQPPYARPNVVASGAGMGEGRQLGGQLNPSVSVNSPNTGNKPIAIDSSLQNSDTVNSGSDSDNSVVSGGGGVGSGGIGDGAGPVSANDTDTQPSGSLHVDIEDAPAGQQVNLAEQSAVHSSSSSSVVSQFSTRGAVIALGLGLSVTALLLLFVGCRLRTVKTRIRRGRPLTSGEADYLINGMYL